MGQAQPPITAGTHPLSETLVINQSTTGAASSTGTGSWSFPAPPAGQVATGTMCCATAPTTAQFVASIGATVLGDWAGDSIAGPWQALNQGQPVLVTATGLTPGQSYLMNWTGSVDDAGGVQPTWPDPNNTSLESLLESPLGIVYGPTANDAQFARFSAIVPNNARTLILIIQGSAASPDAPISVTITGATTNFPYYAGPPYLTGLSDESYIVVVPVNGAADITYNIGVNYSGVPAFTPTYSVYADTDQYKESIFYNGETQFASGDINGATIVDGPCRIASLIVSYTNGTSIGVTYNPPSGGPISLFTIAPTSESGSAPIPFPPDVTLPIGSSITMVLGAGAATVAAVFAYP